MESRSSIWKLLPGCGRLRKLKDPCHVQVQMRRRLMCLNTANTAWRVSRVNASRNHPIWPSNVRSLTYPLATFPATSQPPSTPTHTSPCRRFDRQTTVCCRYVHILCCRNSTRLDPHVVPVQLCSRATSESGSRGRPVSVYGGEVRVHGMTDFPAVSLPRRLRRWARRRRDETRGRGIAITSLRHKVARGGELPPRPGRPACQEGPGRIAPGSGVLISMCF